jgi:thiamine monophosphate synthase
MLVLAITPGEGFQPSRWQRLLDAGLDGFMIREPALEARDLLEAVRFVQRRAPGMDLWVNGRLDVALAGRCGLHTPEAHPPVPPGLVPRSCPVHDPAQLPARCRCRQVILSPIFPVPGKGPAWGPGRLGAVLDALDPAPVRILALGGITPENAASLRHPRLDGVALIRGLWGAGDPALAVARLRAAWESHPSPPLPEESRCA